MGMTRRNRQACLPRVARRRQGQSTLEYAIVLTAVILAIAAAASGPIKEAMRQMFNDISTRIQSASGKIAQ